MIKKCDCNIIHEKTVNDTISRMPKIEEMEQMSKFFKVLGDNTRIKIVCALLQNEMCVCDIAYLLNMTKSAISHQLAILKDLKIVKNRRVGKEVFYSLDDEHVDEIISVALVHINHKY